jgi:glycerate-2-kinase
MAGSRLRVLAGRRRDAAALLLEIGADALDAVDAGQAVRKHVSRVGDGLQIAGHRLDLTSIDRIVVLALGKAAPVMATALVQCVGDIRTEGVVVAHRTQQVPDGLTLYVGGHPLPDAGSLLAGRALMGAASGSGERDLVICLLSGGASALAEVPVPGVTLEDLRETTDLLLRSGATIDEINAVRVRLSLLKGGGLAERARRAELVTLAISDVPPEAPYLIGSGPTLPFPGPVDDPRLVVRTYGLDDVLPTSVSARVSEESDRRLRIVHPKHVTTVIADRSTAARAAASSAEERGLPVRATSTELEGQACVTARDCLTTSKEPGLWIWAGETTVSVTGQGRGGRNQEAALAIADIGRGLEGFTFLALATDGRDGPTDAAGAVVDGTTARQAHERGFDVSSRLADNDSYPVLEAVEALLKPGATGTNVGDLWLLLRDQ